MGQKVNPNLLRLNIIRNWNNSWYSHNYSKSALIDNQIDTYLNRIFFYIGFLTSKILIKQRKNTIYIFVSFYEYLTSLKGKKKKYRIKGKWNSFIMNKFFHVHLKDNYNTTNILKLKESFKNQQDNIVNLISKNTFLNKQKNILKSLINKRFFVVKRFFGLPIIIMHNRFVFNLKRIFKTLEKITNKKIKLNLYKTNFVGDSANLLANYIIFRIKYDKFSPRATLNKLYYLVNNHDAKQIDYFKHYIKCIDISYAGSFNKGKMARTIWLEKYLINFMPLHTISADIDYKHDNIVTKLSSQGFKVWIYNKREQNEI